MSCVNAADNTTEDIVAIEENYVTDDILTDENADSGSFSELNQSISSATGNTLVLEKDYTFKSDDQTKGFENGILINKDITIDGRGHTIDAKSKVRIFNITAKNVQLLNIKFINGHHDNSGGAVVFKETGRINDCTFINNTAKYYGGAVYMPSGGIVGCNFINNSVENEGGAVHTQTGQIEQVILQIIMLVFYMVEPFIVSKQILSIPNSETILQELMVEL